MNKKKALKMSPVMNVPAPLLMTKEYKEPLHFTVKYNGSQIFLYKKDLIELDLSQQVSDFVCNDEYFCWNFSDGAVFLFFNKNKYYYKFYELFGCTLNNQKDDMIFMDCNGKEYFHDFMEINNNHVFIEIQPKR